MKKADARLHFVSLFKTAQEVSKRLDFTLVAEELSVTEATLDKWATEISKADDSEAIRQLLELDNSISMEITSQEPEKPVVDEPGLRTEIVNGKIVVIDAAADRATTMKETKRTKMREGLDGLQLLNADVQSTATTLVSKIQNLVETDPEMSARDVSNLASALTNIQNAFFNKPVTNIQVNTMAGNGESMLSQFKANLQP